MGGARNAVNTRRYKTYEPHVTIMVVGALDGAPASPAGSGSQAPPLLQLSMMVTWVFCITKYSHGEPPIVIDRGHEPLASALHP